MDPAANTIVAAIVAVVGAGAAVAAANLLRRFTGFRLELMGIAIDIPKKASDVASIEGKLERVEALTEEMSQLNAQIRQDLRHSLAEATRLEDKAAAAKREVEIANQLASMTKEQASAMRSIVQQDTKAGRWFQIVVAFVVFVLGVLSAVFVPELVKIFFPAS